MNLKGKFVRRDGTLLIFGSMKKPEWKPIEASGQIDVTQLEPGSYYDIEIEDNRLVRFSKLAPRSGGGGGGGYSAPSGGGGGGSEITMNSLLASATGFAKSCLESGVCKTPAEAAQAGIKWAQVWGEVPDRTPPPAPVRLTPVELDDEMPF